jgi:hypothetical protein
MNPIHPKKFKDVEVSTPYVTFHKVEQPIRYKLFNNQIEIHMKEIVDAVLKDAGITGFDTEQMLVTIPYNIDDVASSETLTILIDKRRFQLRLPEMHAIVNKQQKIDWDNTHPHRWSLAQWGKYIESRFWNSYGVRSLELDLRGNQGAIRRGKVFGLIRSLIGKIKAVTSFNGDEDTVVEYINWVFTRKATKVALTLPLITCDTMVQEFVIWKKQQIKSVENKEISDKWKDD